MTSARGERAAASAAYARAKYAYDFEPEGLRDWMIDAACRDMDTDAFFGNDTKWALSVCAGCPVQQECRDYADLVEGLGSPRLLFGVFGGEAPQARAYRRRGCPPKTCAWCHGPFFPDHGLSRYCSRSCAASAQQERWRNRRRSGKNA